MFFIADPRLIVLIWIVVERDADERLAVANELTLTTASKAGFPRDEAPALFSAWVRIHSNCQHRALSSLTPMCCAWVAT
jgi:hypothetical protein